jgi:hypothetical protein
VKARNKDILMTKANNIEFTLGRDCHIELERKKIPGAISSGINEYSEYRPGCDRRG